MKRELQVQKDDKIYNKKNFNELMSEFTFL